MNISRENIDDLTAVIKIDIEPTDYQEIVEKKLEDYRKKVRMDGLRPGKAPAGLVKKIYGKAIQIDEVQQLLGEKLNSYIHDNNLKIMGEPIPSENTQPIDWENDESFHFQFDIAISPEVTLNLNDDDKFIDYRVQITEEMIDDQVTDYTQRFGSVVPAEEIDENDVVRGDLCQVTEEGESGCNEEHDHEHDHENSIHAHGTLIHIKSIADEEIKRLFIGKKVNDTVVFNPNVAFPNETDRASLLRIEKEQLEGIDSDFTFTIHEISRQQPAEVNQELFDKCFGKDAADSVESFREQIREDLTQRFDHEAHYRFHLDAKKHLMEKTEVPLPEEFLKRWMLTTSQDDKLTREQLDLEFPLFAEDLKWRMIKNVVVEEQKFEITTEELREQAYRSARTRYQQYGLYDVPFEQIIRLADALLENEDEKRKMSEQVLEGKVIKHVKTVVKLEEKEISVEDFYKLFDEN